jgi:hypothetical protein
VLVPKVSELKPMALALILTNVLRTLTPAGMMQFVLTLKADIPVNVLRVITASLTVACVPLPNVDVPLIKSVVRMKSVFNLANVFAHPPSLSMPAISVEVLVNDSLVVLTPNVVQPIHLNVCAKPVSRVTHCWAV